MLKPTLLIAGLAAVAAALIHGQAPLATAAAQTAAPQQTAAGAPAAAAAAETPVQLADATPQGTLKNPYSDTDAKAVAAGEKLWFNNGCNGCHGGGGGGGMCPPVTNEVWVYGGDDDTLFRLVSYGSQILQSKGYTRKQQENVVGPMPQMGLVVKTADDLWHIIAWIRSKYNGAPECKYGCKPL